MDSENKCSICGKKSVFYSNYLKQNLCKKHFERMIIGRVKSNFTSKKIDKKGLYITKENHIGEEFLNFLFDEKGKDTRLYSYTLEDFAVSVMRYFLFHEPSNKKIVEVGSFSPLFNVSENEIIEFFRLKKKELNEIERTGKDASVLKFLKEIEHRRPGGMISLVKAGMSLGII